MVVAIGTSAIVIVVIVVMVRDEDWEGDTVGDFIVNVGEGAQVSQIIAIVIIVGCCYGQMMVVMVPFMIVVVFMIECC